MRLGVDATPLLGHRTGVATFVAGALYGLARSPDTAVVGYGLSGRRGARLGATLPAGVITGRVLPASPLLRLWQRWDFPPAEWLTGPVDVVHGTNFVVPPSRSAGRVVTVHDLAAVRFPDLCAPASLRYPDLARRAASQGAWVHTPSAFVAAEVTELLDVSPDRVRAVPHGVGAPGAAERPLDESPPRDRPYVLALGTVEPRKDLPLLVRAWDEIAKDHAGVDLVIAGPDGWGSDALGEAIDAARHRGRIQRVGWVSDRERHRWLAHASAYAMASVYEGFGLPPLEAMAAGVPVVCTAAGAVPEVVGDAADVVPVGDCEALAAALSLVLGDEAHAARLVERGRVRASLFSWEACAAGLLRLYADAAA